MVPIVGYLSTNISNNIYQYYTSTASAVRSLPIIEEVSMKWLERPSVIEMESGGVYEMYGRKKCQK